MLRLLVLLFALTSRLDAQVDLSKPIPAISLSDGRVIRNATISTFNAETVVLRTAGAPVLVRYEALPDDIRAEAEKRRPGGPRWFAGDTSANTLAIDGQVFIQTQGAGTYKFGNVPVYAFDLAALSYFDQSSGTVQLPKPIHVATTDGDGNFEIRVPVGRPYFIFAQASRVRTAGPDVWTERFEWRVPMSSVRRGQKLVLSADHRHPPRSVRIEPIH